uniref:RAN binding protein 2 n=1 Tax=Cercocebus atys TaxID=9531 RepID=A0A2K5LWT2_CERAT
MLVKKRRMMKISKQLSRNLMENCIWMAQKNVDPWKKIQQIMRKNVLLFGKRNQQLKRRQKQIR